MRWTPENAVLFTGQVTSRSVEMFSAFSLNYQTIVDAIRRENPNIPFVLVPFGSVVAGVATGATKKLDPSDFDVLIIYDKTNSTGFRTPSFSRQSRKLHFPWEIHLFTTAMQNLREVALYSPEINENDLLRNSNAKELYEAFLGYFLVMPMYGDKESISAMRKFRQRIVRELRLEETQSVRDRIQQVFQAHVVNYSSGNKVGWTKHGERLPHAQALLGISHEEWQARRSVRFPT